LRRCLQKDPHRRLRDIGDARMELEDALTAAAEPASVTRGRPAVAAIGVASLLVGAAAAIVVSRTWLGAKAAPVIRFSFPLGPNEVVHPLTGPGVALSPDGNRIAYAANKDGRSQIYVRALDQLEAKPIAGTAGGGAPFFSPDGQWLAFRQV